MYLEAADSSAAFVFGGDRDFWMVARAGVGPLASPFVNEHFDASLRRASLIANTVVLVVVLFPLFGNARFSFLSAEGAVYLGLIALLNVWLYHGATLLEQIAVPRVLSQGVYFSGLVAAFAAVFWSPVHNGNAWLLAMPLVAAGVILLRWPGVVLVALSLLGTIAVRAARGAGAGWYRETIGSVSQLAVAMLFTAGCTLLAMRERASRTRAEDLARELEAANGELRASAERNAQLAAAQERNRIARDIHDGLGHYLTTIAVQLQAARALLPTQPEKALEVVEKAEQGSQQALNEVRRSVGTLRAAASETDLARRIEALVADAGLDVAFVCEGAVRPLPPAVDDALFRTVQEALTNVRKHSGTKHAGVRLVYSSDKRVVLEVTDSGRGSGAPGAGRGFGLRGLRERVVAVGGTLAAENRPDGGFRVGAEVPA